MNSINPNGCHNMTAGISLKPEHYNDVLHHKALGLWYEIHVENYFMKGGPRRRFLNEISESTPISFHGVGGSLGGLELPDPEHLKKVKLLIDEINPILISEHAAWSKHQTDYFADLLPIPKTHEAMIRLVNSVDAYQNAIGREILIENPTNYLPFISEIDEPDFLSEVSDRTGCGLLLDITNLYLSHVNTGININDYLNTLPKQSVKEIHVAGFDEDKHYGAELLIDSHGSDVPETIWHLLNTVLDTFSAPVLIERDGNIPSYNSLIAEREHAHTIIVNKSTALPSFQTSEHHYA